MCSGQFSVPVRSPVVQDSSPAAFASLSSSHISCMLGWPPNRSSVLGRRGYAVESAAARVCRDAGSRVKCCGIWTCSFLRALFAGAQTCFRHHAGEPTPLRRVSASRSTVHRWGCPHLSAARRKKERAYPELVGSHGRVRLVFLAGGGRTVSEETRLFISQLAKAKSRAEPFVLRRRVEQAWRFRWSAMLCCAAVFVSSPGTLHRGGL